MPQFHCEGRLLELEAILRKPGLDRQTHKDRLIDHIESYKEEMLENLTEISVNCQNNHTEPLSFLLDAYSSLKCAKLVAILTRKEDLQEPTSTVFNRVMDYIQNFRQGEVNQYSKKMAKFFERSIHHLHLFEDHTNEDVDINLLNKIYRLSEGILIFIIKYYIGLEKISEGGDEATVLSVMKELVESNNIIETSIFGSGKKQKDYFGIKMLTSKYKSIYRKISNMAREVEDEAFLQHVNLLAQGALSLFTFCANEDNFESVEAVECLEDFDEEPVANEILIVDVEPEVEKDCFSQMKDAPSDEKLLQRPLSKTAFENIDFTNKNTKRKNINLQEMELSLKNTSLLPKDKSLSSEDSSSEEMTHSKGKGTRPKRDPENQFPFTLSLKHSHSRGISRKGRGNSSSSSSSEEDKNIVGGLLKKRISLNKIKRKEESNMWMWGSVVAGTVILGGIGWFLYWYFCISNVAIPLSSLSSPI